MKIVYDDYNWKLIGIPKNDSTEKEITIFSEIVGYIIERIMEELSQHDAVLTPDLIRSGDYKSAKVELKRKLKLVQDRRLITVTAISRLTKIPEQRLSNFITDDEEFNTGELFILSSVLDKILGRA